jgi:hypothetical protein
VRVLDDTDWPGSLSVVSFAIDSDVIERALVPIGSNVTTYLSRRRAGSGRVEAHDSTAGRSRKAVHGAAAIEVFSGHCAKEVDGQCYGPLSSQTDWMTKGRNLSARANRNEQDQTKGMVLHVRWNSRYMRDRGRAVSQSVLSGTETVREGYPPPNLLK